MKNSESFSSELIKTCILSFLILPILMCICVGTYGLLVWLLQMFVIGLPTA